MLAVCVAMACAGSGHAPLSPSGGLNPDLAEGQLLASGPFRVVFAAPVGDAPEAAEISLVFDRPLVPLGTAGQAPPAIAVTPALPGSFRWVGARALVFVPEAGGLPAATEFIVEVPKSVRAADGSMLAEAHRFTFTTPRPSVVTTAPADGWESVLPTTALTLELNQRVDPKSIERFGVLSAAGKKIPFSASRPSPDATKKVIVQPQQPLPLDSEIRFTLSEALTGEEGPLTAGKASSVAFRTYGPLRVTEVSCNRDSPRGHCLPSSGVGVLFSNPVRFGDVKRLLQVAPPVPFVWPAWQEDASTTTYVEVPGKLDAGQRYQISIAKGLHDIYGQPLARDVRMEVVMDDYFPRVAIGIEDGTLLAQERAPIPIASVNAKGAKVRAAALSRDDISRLARGAADLGAILRAHPSSYDLVLPSVAGTNRIHQSAIDPKVVLPQSGRGVLALLAEYTGDSRDYGAPERERIAKVSDIGIVAKFSRHGSLVWLTRLSSAEPVASAEIELSRPDGRRLRYRSDADGMAEIPASDYAPNLDWDSKDRNAILFAASGGDWNYEKIADISAPWGSGVPVDLSGAQRDRGLVFTDRGVYRPGDTLRVKGVVRREAPSGSTIPQGEKVRLTLLGPAEEPLRKVEVPISAFGTFHSTLKLPPASGLGDYRLSATLGRNEISARFAVEEYRPAEFRVEVTGPESALRGEVVSFEVLANYLFGAPVAGGTSRYSVTRAVTGFKPAKTDELSTDASVYYADLDEAPLEGGPLLDAEAALDARGGMTVSQALTLPGQRSVEFVTLESEVTDVARASVMGRASVLVHPAEFYVGIAPIEEFVQNTPAKLRPAVAAISPAGERLSGKRIQLELVQRKWTHSTQSAGGVYPESRPKVVDTVVARCEVVSGGALASCPLEVPRAGYYLVRGSARDARGNVAEAAVSLYAPGSAEGAFRSEDETTLELVLDKSSYRVGEKARVLVKSPFTEAEALITVERAGIQRRERRKLRGSLPSFEVLVTEQQRPNAFVSVHLIRKLAGSGSGTAYRFGYAELRLDPEQQRLQVNVSPSARELRPGDDVAVQVAVTDAKGAPARAEVTLYAVDEGVLMLTGYAVPDPLPVFTASRPLQVGTLDTRSAITRIRASGLERLLLGNKGEEGGGGGESAVRRDFQQTAYFNPSLITDARGRTTAKFKLPDSLTRYRVMAVAVADGDRFGFGSSDVTTSKPLMARPALARFLRAGDRMQAGVVVSTKSIGARDVNVGASAQGLVLEGTSSKRVRVENDGSQEVRFTFRAVNPGRARIRFDVQSGAERDAVEVERVVMAPSVLEATAVSGSTTGLIAEQLGSLRGVRPDVGGLEVSLAPTALVGLDVAIEELADYPYACTEQVASRLVPLVVAARLGASREDDGSDLTRSASAALRDLLSRQRGDGGFGLWADAEQSHAWVSAHATWLLHAVDRVGLEVPDRALKAAREYLRRYLGQARKDPLARATGAFAVDVLASAGEPDQGYMNHLFDERRGLPLFARALLLSALSSANSDTRQIQELQREIEASVRVSGESAAIVENVRDAYAVLMDSAPRTHALVLRALVFAAPEHPLLPLLARGLLATRRGGTWATTQESAFALAALAAYREAVEKVEPDFRARAFLGEKGLIEARFSGPSFQSQRAEVPMSRLMSEKDARLRFDREGRGTLYYQARLRYARTELPRAPLDAGFYIEKRLSAVDPSSLLSQGGPLPLKSSEGFRAGDLVLAEIAVVSSAPREYVVIDDPLPAGFEAINASLLTTASRYDLANFASSEPCPECESERDRIAEGRFIRESQPRRELYDDRVAFLVDHLPPGIHRFRYLARATTLGTFIVPPARVFGMYSPELFGRTFAESVEIR